MLHSQAMYQALIILTPEPIRQRRELQINPFHQPGDAFDFIVDVGRRTLREQPTQVRQHLILRLCRVDQGDEFIHAARVGIHSEAKAPRRC